jgi:hypothetical protein
MSDGQSWAPSEAPAQTTSGYDLRPLSTGEVLDRTFQLYRSRFALFASLAALPAAINFAGGALQLLFIGSPRAVQNVPASARPLITAGITLITLLVYFVFYGITQAATTWAVAEIYLGRPASVRTSWKSATAHWVRYVLVTLRQYWSICWWPFLALIAFVIVLALVPRLSGGATVAAGILAFVFGLQLLASFIYAVYAGIRVSLAIPASVIEALTANPAVHRSMVLLVQRKGRILLMWLMVIAMGMIVGIVLSPLTFIAMALHGAERYILQMIQLTGSFLTSMLIAPIAAIALCLFYFDERVRHEGFDIEFLMLRSGSAPANPAGEGTTSPEPA